jgi:adenosine deaminase
VVGLDWFGDELAAPYCALAHSRFIGQDGIVKTMREIEIDAQKARNLFGIRVHCGEGLPVLPFHVENESKIHTIFNKHISIVHKGLKRIWETIGNRHDSADLNKVREWKGVRIGHGIAFLQEHVNLPAVRDILKFLLETQIVCELNMTSNAYLLKHHPNHLNSDDERDLVVRQFLDKV